MDLMITIPEDLRTARDKGSGMRPSLIWNWRLLCERLALASLRHRRLAKLRNTPARSLSLGHIESLELLELIEDADAKVIYDVGANVGTWTLLAKSIFPASRVEAFEPLPSHHGGFESAGRPSRVCPRRRSWSPT